ncbi:hypothetical protein MUK42_12091 [Musa troglodytarum]|uniref:DUF7731 domain-containing protein n=1 Tax=Musa troglodytarum TaxID=320322 RepID=A0A9E7GRY1_9LILI|nr:hypothetical protein MUK42_12091 [Musa troglodytarum]
MKEGLSRKLFDYKSTMLYLSSPLVSYMLEGTMSSISPLKCWCLLLAVLCLSTSCCKSDQNAEDIVASALACFNDRYVYSSCQESYRLNAGGTLNVPREATDGYCGGPCLTETKLVLSCVDNILYNFRFYNGASVRDVRYTLDAGCGHTSKRGDFNVNEHLDDDIDAYGGCYDHGDRLAVRVYLLILFSCVLLL